jgi:hypothetical protein
MNMMATPVVILVSILAGPAAPKKVWPPPPPMEAPISAPLPLWRRTIKIKRIQTLTCKPTIIDVIIFILPYSSYLMILINLSASRLAPPTRAPSTSSISISSFAFSGLTEPPYNILIFSAISFENNFSIKTLKCL